MKDRGVSVRRVELQCSSGGVSYRWFHPEDEVPDVFFENYYEYGNRKTLNVIGNEIFTGTAVSEVFVLEGNACVVVRFAGKNAFDKYETFSVELLG